MGSDPNSFEGKACVDNQVLRGRVVAGHQGLVSDPAKAADLMSPW